MHVVISYSREDRDVAANLARLLEAEGITTWWDWQITAGADFRTAIGGQIAKANKVIVLWSERSTRSDFVIDEASRAKAAGKLIPVSIDSSEPPLGFGGLHTIQMPDWITLPPELLAALQDRPPAQGPDLAASVRAPIRDGALAGVSVGDRTGTLAAIERDIAEYARWLVAAATSPMELVTRTAEARTLNRHIPHVMRILFISVLIGASLGALIPERPPLLGRAIIFVLVTLVWFFISLLVHGVCRLMRGGADAGMTLLLMMQALAFAYVASNLLTVLIFQLGKFYAPELLGHPVPAVTGTVLLGLQFVVLFLLVPATVSRAHGFHGTRWFTVAVAAATLTFIIGVPIAAVGGC